MDKIILFQEKYIVFQDLLILTSELYIKFWKELLKDTPGTTLVIYKIFDRI